MRTKTLLLTAAIGMAGALTLSAQIYSVNAVGYVNLTLPGAPDNSKWSMIANPLNGTNNNNLDTILPLTEADNGTIIWRYNRGPDQVFYESFTWVFGAGWLTAGDPSTKEIHPGEGLWIAPVVPVLNVTFVGEVPQGDALHNTLPDTNQWALISSVVPQAARVGDTVALNDGDLDYPAENGDLIWQYDNQNQVYRDSSTYIQGLGWLSADTDVTLQGPMIPVGTGVWLQKAGDSTQRDWVRNFHVN